MNELVGLFGRLLIFGGVLLFLILIAVLIFVGRGR